MQMDDGSLDIDLVDLVFSQISAVQGSLQDIDMKAIAEKLILTSPFLQLPMQEHKLKNGLMTIKKDHLKTLVENSKRPLKEIYYQNIQVLYQC